MRRLLLILTIIGFGMAFVLIPIGYRSHLSVKYRNFRTVSPGVLYRSGQMTTEGLTQKVREHGLKTVVSLRELRDKDGKTDADHAEIEFCRNNGVRHLVLTPMQWRREQEEHAPVEENLAAFLKLMNDPTNHPVLVHCFAGIHRTGGYVAMYRMQFDRWTAEEAVEEMKTMGTPRTTFDPDTSALLRHLEGKSFIR